MSIPLAAVVAGTKNAGKALFDIGRKSVPVLGKIAAGTAMAGGVVNNWLQEKLPLDSHQAMSDEDAKFSSINVQVSPATRKQIELLQATARTLGDEESISLVQSIISQLNDETFKILVVGRFSTGKSSLLNKLLGKPILKKDDLPTTKTLTWLSYSENESAWYHDAHDVMHKIPAEEIVNIPEEPPVLNVFALINAEILRHGAVFIDTPGLNDTDEAVSQITLDALSGADAVILLIDGFSPSASEKDFIQTLKNMGLAQKLFAVRNKLDEADDPDEWENIRAYCIKILSGMEIRTRLFMLSCKDGCEGINNNEFERFKRELIQHIDTSLRDTRKYTVEQRIKNTAAFLRKLCQEAEAANALNAEERIQKQRKNAEKIYAVEREIEKTIRHNQNELLKLKSPIKGRWAEVFAQIKDQVSGNINSANDAQLSSNLNQFLQDVAVTINDFLTAEFENARRQLAEMFDKTELPVPVQDKQIALNFIQNRGLQINIPPQFGTIGVLAYTILTVHNPILLVVKGYITMVLSPVINKIFEQINGVLGNISISMYKKRILDSLEDKWIEIDRSVLQEIDGYFAKLSKEVEKTGKETINALMAKEKRETAFLESNNQSKPFADYNERLADIV
jgi:GTPase Era involved in 16S rRNA processing